MLRPISQSADVAHKNFRRPVLMLRDEIADRFIKIERQRNRDRGNSTADDPVKNVPALHNKVPVTIAGRYFDRALEINQLRAAVFRLHRFPRCRDLERPIDRSRRAALRRGVTRDDRARRLHRSAFQ